MKSKYSPRGLSDRYATLNDAAYVGNLQNREGVLSLAYERSGGSLEIACGFLGAAGLAVGERELASIWRESGLQTRAYAAALRSLVVVFAKAGETKLDMMTSHIQRAIKPIGNVGTPTIKKYMLESGLAVISGKPFGGPNGSRRTGTKQVHRRGFSKSGFNRGRIETRGNHVFIGG